MHSPGQKASESYLVELQRALLRGGSFLDINLSCSWGTRHQVRVSGCGITRPGPCQFFRAPPKLWSFWFSFEANQTGVPSKRSHLYEPLLIYGPWQTAGFRLWFHLPRCHVGCHVFDPQPSSPFLVAVNPSARVLGAPLLCCDAKGGISPKAWRARRRTCGLASESAAIDRRCARAAGRGEKKLEDDGPFTWTVIGQRIFRLSLFGWNEGALPLNPQQVVHFCRGVDSNQESCSRGSSTVPPQAKEAHLCGKQQLVLPGQSAQARIGRSFCPFGPRAPT